MVCVTQITCLESAVLLLSCFSIVYKIRLLLVIFNLCFRVPAIIHGRINVKLCTWAHNPGVTTSMCFG